jgi:hypothetical protein
MGLESTDNLVEDIPVYLDTYQRKQEPTGYIKRRFAKIFAEAKKQGVSEKDVKAYLTDRETNPYQYEKFQKALKAAILGGAKYESSSESEDDMCGGGLFSSIASIASKAARSGATAASKVGSEVVTVSTKGARAVADDAARAAALAPSLASRIGSKVMTAANTVALAAGIGLPVYQVVEMMKQEKEAAAAQRAQELAQQKADTDTAKALAANQSAVDAAIAAAVAEKARWEQEQSLVAKAYADSAADQKKQSDAFDAMMAMILSGKNSDLQTSPAPPVASGPTQNEIDQAIATATGSRLPPTVVPVVPTAPPAYVPPPTPAPPAPAPAGRRRKGGVKFYSLY